MEWGRENKVEINANSGSQVIVAGDSAVVNATQNNRNVKNGSKHMVKNRVLEYAKKWNENMFLNNFDKRDENAGINVKLREVYLDKHLPHYMWEENRNVRKDIKDLLLEFIYETNVNKMLLILGHPGIGKSTLITWIAANFIKSLEKISVYKFASDLKNINWKNNKSSSKILGKLGLTYSDLEDKTLILDGFDEISIGDNRREILNGLYDELIYEKKIKHFSLIITCRENYVQVYEGLKCSYITLQPWDEDQIHSFCNVFQKKTHNYISKYTINKILESRKILGIPLILYMVLSLNISIEKNGSIVDVYDRIFSLDGGIYERCIENKNFADKHRISEIKKQIHQISRDIAIWMFENKPEEAYILKKEYKKVCSNIVQADGKANSYIEMDFMIGNFFKIRHCEEIKGEELYFVHRSIYEYFVAETIYSSIEHSLLELSEESKKELACNISHYLKTGKITKSIGDYLQYKISKLYENKLSCKKKEKFYQWWESAVYEMIEFGMFYFSRSNIQDYKDILDKELNCFGNILKLLWFLIDYDSGYTLSKKDSENFKKYFIYFITMCRIQSKNEKLDLGNIYLKNADLIKVDLKGASLINSCLIGANLAGADLTGADLTGANLINANLFAANIDNIELDGAKLEGAIFDESQVEYLKDKYSLQKVKVYIKKTGKIVEYREYLEKWKCLHLF